MKRTRYLAGVFALAALVSLAIGQQTPALAGFTKLVDQDPNGCQQNTGVYATITEALDDQQAGDVIYVCPGTYVEPTLVLTENLTLTGPDTGGAIIQMANPTTDGRAIFVNTNNSVVTHLEIDATPPAGYVGQTTGLRDGGDSNVFSHLTITNADIGIDIQGSEPMDNLVTENNITARSYGILCQCTDSFVTNNTVQSPNNDEITGIFISGGQRFEVSGNTLTRAQLAVNAQTGTITDNHVIGNGATDYDLVGLYQGPMTFADNIIEHAGRNAIGIYAPYFDTTVTIVRNTIRDARIGILTLIQDPHQIHAVVGGSAANANTFVDSGGTLDDANYLFQQGSDVNTVDATFNDWGLCSLADIEKEVYHSADNGSLGTVLFDPFVTGASCPTPTPPPTSPATPTPTTAPTQSPTATPDAGELQWGDFTCNGTFGPEDGLAIAVDAAELFPEQQEPCPEIDGRTTVNQTSRAWGDFDCDGAVDFDDMLKLLAALADLPYDAEPGCPDAGEVVDVVGPDF